MSTRIHQSKSRGTQRKEAEATWDPFTGKKERQRSKAILQRKKSQSSHTLPLWCTWFSFPALINTSVRAQLAKQAHQTHQTRRPHALNIFVLLKLMIFFVLNLKCTLPIFSHFSTLSDLVQSLQSEVCRAPVLPHFHRQVLPVTSQNEAKLFHFLTVHHFCKHPTHSGTRRPTALSSMLLELRTFYPSWTSHFLHA